MVTVVVLSRVCNVLFISVPVMFPELDLWFLCRTKLFRKRGNEGGIIILEEEIINNNKTSQMCRMTTQYLI